MNVACLLLECAFFLDLTLAVLGFSCQHLLHLLCKADSLTLTAHLTSRAGALLGFFVEHATLSPAHTVLAVVRNPSFITAALGPLILCEAAGSMARADVPFDLIGIGTGLDCLCVARALALAIGANKPNITLADSNSHLASGLDKALAVTTTDLTLEHWACHMAGLASVWLLALTAGAIGHLFIILDAGSTIRTTTGEV